MIETRRGEIRQELIDLARDMAAEFEYQVGWIDVDVPVGIRGEVEQALRAIFSKIEIPTDRTGTP
ncbi:hypothetical protein SEA_DATBOI_78 [Gordonia phage DatBoi]|nr:hypothetical protein SEA_DATBOI_78 [Gordonia phage DatBoi]